MKRLMHRRVKVVGRSLKGAGRSWAGPEPKAWVGEKSNKANRGWKPGVWTKGCKLGHAAHNLCPRKSSDGNSIRVGDMSGPARPGVQLPLSRLSGCQRQQGSCTPNSQAGEGIWLDAASLTPHNKLHLWEWVTPFTTAATIPAVLNMGARSALNTTGLTSTLVNLIREMLSREGALWPCLHL